MTTLQQVKAILNHNFVKCKPSEAKKLASKFGGTEKVWKQSLQDIRGAQRKGDTIGAIVYCSILQLQVIAVIVEQSGERLSFTHVLKTPAGNRKVEYQIVPSYFLQESSMLTIDADGGGMLNGDGTIIRQVWLDDDSGDAIDTHIVPLDNPSNMQQITDINGVSVDVLGFFGLLDSNSA